MNRILIPLKRISGTIQVPGDKSISHRAFIISSLASGPSFIEGALTTGDCFSTIQCLGELGVEMDIGENTVVVHGKGLHGYRCPDHPLDAGNSGTTLRLLAGVAAGQPFTTVMTGDDSLRRRPMNRIIRPLTMMGAAVFGEDNDTRAPLRIHGGVLNPLNSYAIPVASAQVKSALLLAGLFSQGTHSLIEPTPTRDHTEIMLSDRGVRLQREGTCISLEGGQEPVPGSQKVPGDFSSAAFLLSAALLAREGALRIEKVGLNPTRTGFLDVLREMGADMDVGDAENWNGEPVGSIHVTSSDLRGVEIHSAMIPRIIDELPLIAVLGMYAEGTTVVRGAEELRFKESDRIRAMAAELRKMGGDVQEMEDGFIVRGGPTIQGASLCSHNDHRVAMALSVAALSAKGTSILQDAECMEVSYPNFYDAVTSLSGKE